LPPARVFLQAEQRDEPRNYDRPEHVKERLDISDADIAPAGLVILISEPDDPRLALN